MGLNDYRYIFLITYARSGSTLLQSLINVAAGVQVRGENKNALFYLFKCYCALRDTASRGRAGKQNSPDTPWYGAGNVKPKWFLTAALERFVTAVLSPEADVTVTGFKEIRHTAYFMSRDDFAGYMQFLLDFFPNSKIVFNSRDPNSVRNSSWLANENPANVMRDVQECDIRFAIFNESSNRSIHMKYEEYVDDHRKVEILYKFLELNFDKDSVERVFAKPLAHTKKTNLSVR